MVNTPIIHKNYLSSFLYKYCIFWNQFFLIFSFVLFCLFVFLKVFLFFMSFYLSTSFTSSFSFHFSALDLIRIYLYFYILIKLLFFLLLFLKVLLFSFLKKKTFNKFHTVVEYYPLEDRICYTSSDGKHISHINP